MTSNKPVPGTLPKSVIDALPSAVAVAKAIDVLNNAMTVLGNQLQLMERDADVQTMARAFVVLHRLNDRIKEPASLFSVAWERWKTEIMPKAIEDSGQAHIPLREGFRVGVSALLRASIKEGMKADAFAWLKKHKLGDLIQPVVNAGTLSAAAKHLMEENKELPEEFFNVQTVDNTSVTKTAVKT